MGISLSVMSGMHFDLELVFSMLLTWLPNLYLIPLFFSTPLAQVLAE